jgi:hypothetical protein
MQTSNNIYLFVADFSVKYATYKVELEAIKASLGGGVLISGLQNIAEAGKEQETRTRSRPLQSIVNSKLFFIIHKICCALSVQQTEVTIL